MRGRALAARPRGAAAATTPVRETGEPEALPGAGGRRAPDPPRRPPTAAPVFLRGRDADARLRALEARRRVARPLLGALAAELVARSLYEPLGYRSLGDYAREHLGLGARCLREWARVSRALAELPLLREAVLAGEISWGVARLVVGLATPETEAACLETVRGRTVRAVEAIVRAVREAQGKAAQDPDEAAAAEEEERVLVRLACTPDEAGMWHGAVELARRVAGEPLALWQCAERIAAEAASAVGSEPEPEAPAGSPGEDAGSGGGEDSLSGLREQAYPRLDWEAADGGEPPEALGELPADRSACSPREIDRRLRRAIAFLQSVDFELGRLLRQMHERGLFAELGFADLAAYARERLDLSGRTARRLIALSRSEHRAPAVATAFREGRLTAFQAQAIARAHREAGAEAAPWVARAGQVSLRRLEEELDALPRESIAFSAPPEAARFFLQMVRRLGLARLLAHAIREWRRLGEAFDDYADFERDGYRCTAPGCTARRNLHSHHIWFRGREGPDVPWNRTTLCACHHQRALHALQGTSSLRVRGRAPDALLFELGNDRGERFWSGDVRC